MCSRYSRVFRVFHGIPGIPGITGVPVYSTVFPVLPVFPCIPVYSTVFPVFPVFPCIPLNPEARQGRLPGNTREYTGIHGNTRVYRLPGVTGGCTRVPPLSSWVPLGGTQEDRVVPWYTPRAPLPAQERPSGLNGPRGVRVAAGRGHHVAALFPYLRSFWPGHPDGLRAIRANRWIGSRSRAP